MVLTSNDRMIMTLRRPRTWARARRGDKFNDHDDDGDQGTMLGEISIGTDGGR